MAEGSSINFVNGSQPSATQLNTPQRKAWADILDILRALMIGDNSPPDYGFVAGGLEASGRVDMKYDVGYGVGWGYNAALIAPQSTWALALLESAITSATISDGDGAFDRIDAICILPASTLLDNELVNQKGAPAAPQYTRRGSGASVVVIEGTPAASPAVPTVPTNLGYILVAYALVPSGLTAGGGGTALCTFIDKRCRFTFNERGPDTPSFGWRQEVDAWSGNVFATRIKGAEGTPAENDELSWIADLNEHWFAMYRLGEPTDDETDHLYPMVVPGGRAHKVSQPFNAGETPDADASVEINGVYSGTLIGVKIIHLTGNADSKTGSCLFQTPARGASFDAYRVKHQVLIQPAAAVSAQAFAYVDATDTIIPLSDATAIEIAVGGPYDNALDNPVEFTPADGDLVFITVDVTFAALADLCAVYLMKGQATITEGRDV